MKHHKSIHTPDTVIYVCEGSKCSKRGGDEIRKKLRKRIKEEGKKNQVWIVKTSCQDLCDHAPIVCCQPANVWLAEGSVENTLEQVQLIVGLGNQ
jgi:NADH:ubiquinone oxidoreductase subunit E